MADNVIANPGVGGATFATDDDGTAQHPYCKVEWGANNVFTKVDSGASALPIQDGGNSITVDGTVAVSGTVTVSGAVTNTGTFAVQATQAGTWNIATVTAVTAITNALPAGTNTIGNVGLIATTSGGVSAFSYIAAASANQDQQSVKGSAGQVYGFTVFNLNTAIRYLKIYNTATPTSASTPVIRIMIPGNTAGAGVGRSFTIGVAFGTAIGIRLTTGQADNDATAVTAGDVVVNIDYA